MAKFTQDLNPTSDPNYLQSSRGYSKSDVATDTSLGKLFETIGGDIGPAVTAVDTTIQHGIRTDLESKLNKVFDDLGGSVTPDEAVAIAGTGARGAKYAAASGAGLTPEDIAPNEATPPDVAKARTDISRWKNAYQAGSMSQTRFQSLVDGIIRDTKLNNPGYSEQIDQMYTEITGRSSANALRRDVLNDFNSMASASSSAANKIQTQFHQDAAYIQKLFPNMDVTEYAQKKDYVDVEVGKLKAHTLGIEIQEKELGLMKNKDEAASRQAGQTYTNRVNTYISTFVNGAMNNLREESETLLAQGPDADPKAVAALQNKYLALRSTIQANLDGIYKMPLGDTANSYSTFLKPADKKAIDDAALGSLDVIVNNLGNKETMGVANSAANILKQRHNQDVLRMEDKFPVLRGVKGIGKDMNPEVASILIQRSGVLPELSRAVIENIWGNTAAAGSTNAEPQSVSDALNALPKTATGKERTVLVQGLKDMLKDVNPGIADAAAKTLFGDPKFFAGVDPSSKEAIYKTLTDDRVRKGMEALKETRPETYQMWSNWVLTNSLPVYKQGIDELNQAQVFNRYDVQFDPKNGHFSATTLPQFADPKHMFTGQMNDPANYYVQKINDLSDRVMPILKEKFGDQAPAQFLSILKQNGYNPDAPKQGTVLEQFGNAIIKKIPELLKPGTGMQQDFQRSQPAQPVQAVPGKQSSNDINDTVVKVASQYVGMDEASNRSTLSSFMTKAAGRRVDPQTEAWCADFANAVLAEAGGQGTGSAMAKSFLKYGTATDAPKSGDVVVLSRGGRNAPTGHVGFFQGYEEHDGQKYVKVLAGNQGNSVSVAEFPVSRVLGYRAVKPGDVKQWKFDTASVDENPTARRG